MKCWLALSTVVFALLACSAGGERSNAVTRSQDGESGAGAGERDETADSPASRSGADQSGPPVSEPVARALLARRFRDAGFRIRYDVRLRGTPEREFDFTVDGYDPDARVGFEYIDPRERGLDLGSDERRALVGDTSHRILIVEPVSQVRLQELADEFLRQVAAP